MTRTPTMATRTSPRPAFATVCAVAIAVMLVGSGVASAAGATTAITATTATQGPTRDGRIVFKDYTANAIFTVNPDGTALQQVIQGSANQFIGDPAWSSDGTRIVFDANLTGQHRVWVMDADGSNLHRVTTDGSGWSNSNPQFTPDATQIVYERCRPDPPGGCAISIVRADGSNRRAITKLVRPALSENDFNPTVSPDGQWISFDRHGQGGIASQAWIAHLDGSAARPVTPVQLEAGGPEWGLDSRHLLVNSLFPHYGSAIYLVDTQTLKLTLLDQPPFPHNDVEGNYSPLGDKIVLLSDRGIPNDRGGNLWMMNPNGSDLHEVNIPSLNNMFHPDWGPAPLQ